MPAPPAPSNTGYGLVLGGGAVRGAFQAGVVSALDRAGIRFDAIAAASVGAVNGAALLLGFGPRLPELWIESLRSLRWIDPLRLLRLQSPFLISESMRLLVARYGDLRRIREHPTELIISTTEWETGRNVLFSSKDPSSTDEERILHFLASLTIPFVSTEKIVVRGRRLCDGVFSCNFPIEPLLARGCREIIVVDPAPGLLEAAIARLLRPIARPIAAIPLPAARFALGFLRALEGPPPAPPGVSLRLISPPPGLTLAGLDFRSLDDIRRALDLGLCAGEALACELRARPEAPPATRPCAPEALRPAARAGE